jgi:hypothetical protein
MWAKEDFKIVEEFDWDNYSSDDTMVFVGLTDLHAIGLSTTLRDLLAKNIQIRIIPMK